MATVRPCLQTQERNQKIQSQYPDISVLALDHVSQVEHMVIYATHDPLLCSRKSERKNSFTSEKKSFISFYFNTIN